MKINNTESSFNNQVQTIMDSELSSRYAFIEHIQPLNEEEDDDDEEEFNRKAEILTEYKESFFYVDEEDDNMKFFNYWKKQNL